MKKQILMIFMMALMISCVSASFTSLGTFKQNSNVPVKQLCATCTHNNVTSVIYPNGTSINQEIMMGINGNEYLYDFNNTDTIGIYTVNGFGDIDGADEIWGIRFEITEIDS